MSPAIHILPIGNTVDKDTPCGILNSVEDSEPTYTKAPLVFQTSQLSHPQRSRVLTQAVNSRFHSLKHGRGEFQDFLFGSASKFDLIAHRRRPRLRLALTSLHATRASSFTSSIKAASITSWAP